MIRDQSFSDKITEKEITKKENKYSKILIYNFKKEEHKREYENYFLYELLGKGTFGTVYLA
jgi:hypothetical protein